MNIQIKRIYDAPDETDGFRILHRSSGNGLVMIRPDTKNSGSDIGKNWKIIRKRSRL